MPADGWPEEDAAAPALLLTSSWERYGNAVWPAVRAVHAERALEHLCARYPVWFERGSQPLRRGSDRSAQITWVEAADGSQHPEFRLDRPQAQLLCGASLWYVDMQAGEYGRATGDARLYRHLADAPALGPTQVAAVAQRLAASPHA